LRRLASIGLAGLIVATLAAVAEAGSIRGGLEADRLQGTPGTDRMTGGFGADRLRGLAGTDTLIGGFGADYLAGGAGRDLLRGDDDNDRLDGGAGADRLEGGDGDDRMAGGGGADRLNGGSGDDRITTARGGADQVGCGEGSDVVVADAGDTASEDCETVSPPQVKPLGTTRERPFPLGRAVATVDGWSMQVVGFQPDATAAVLAENIFSDPPPAGSVFSIVRVRATRLGAGAATFSGAFRLRAVGSAAVVYSTFENSCGVIPNELPDPQVFLGGTIEGNECWAVPASEAQSLVLVDSPITPDRQRFLALR
jgi:hypothetical protein